MYLGMMSAAKRIFSGGGGGGGGGGVGVGEARFGGGGGGKSACPTSGPELVGRRI